MLESRLQIAALYEDISEQMDRARERQEAQEREREKQAWEHEEQEVVLGSYGGALITPCEAGASQNFQATAFPWPGAEDGHFPRMGETVQTYSRQQLLGEVEDAGQDERIDNETGPFAGETACTYRADNRELQANTKGIAFRNSKRIDDRNPTSRILPWGSDVIGYDEGDDWICVEGFFLPMTFDGCRIIWKIPTQPEEAMSSSSSLQAQAVKTSATTSKSHVGCCPCFEGLSRKRDRSSQDALRDSLPDAEAACSALAPLVERCAELADERRMTDLKAEIRRLEEENSELARSPAAGMTASPLQPPTAPVNPGFTAMQSEFAALEEALRRARHDLREHETTAESRRNDLASMLIQEQGRLHEHRQMREREEEQLRDQVRLREEAHRRHLEEQRMEAELAAEQRAQRLRLDHERGAESLRAEHEQLRIEHEKERRRLEEETMRFREVHSVERLRQSHEEERRRLEAEMHQIREQHRVEQDSLGKLRSEQQRMQEQALLQQQREEAVRREAARQEEEIRRREEEARREEMVRREEMARQEEQSRQELEAASKKRREEAARHAEEARRQEQEILQRRQQAEEELRKQRAEAERMREQRDQEEFRRRAKEEEVWRIKLDQSRATEERQRLDWEMLHRREDEDWRRRETSGATPYYDISSPSPVRSHLFEERTADYRAGAFSPRSMHSQDLQASSFSRSAGNSVGAASNGFPFSTRSTFSGGRAREETRSGALSSVSSTNSGKRHQINNLLADLDKLAGDLQSVFTTSKYGSPLGSPARASSVTAVPARSHPSSPHGTSWAKSQSPARNKGSL